ncbi:MAG: hypothetical protein WA459_04545 [Stellaceae bacterium]
MLVTQGGRTIVDVRARAAPAEDVMTPDYYTQLPQIRLSANPTSRETHPEIPIEVTLDDTDVAKLVECALRHPNPNMCNSVLAAIWNHSDSFRQIFQFGLNAPDAFPEIRQIVADALDKRRATLEAGAANGAKPAAGPLLPRMPMPAHLRDRERQE